ncbi:MAG: glycosyltransferase family 4 protein [Pseudomonadota bacterium]
MGIHQAYRLDIDGWYDTSIEPAVRQIIETHSIDVVLVEYVFLSKIFDVLPDNVLKILDTHDVFSNRHLRYLRQGEEPQWFSCSPQSESVALRRADVVLAIQLGEAEHFSRLGASDVVTVGHSVRLENVYQKDGLNGESVILYVGSSNSINTASIQWFQDHVLPKVVNRVQARLHVVGSVCDSVSERRNVRLHGRVGDLNELYRIADVVINPARFGTGLKIKTIEALGLGLPLVTTSVGAEGLSRGSNTAFLQANSATEFAEKVVRLIRDKNQRASISERAIEFAGDYNRAVIQAFGSALDRQTKH